MCKGYQIQSQEIDAAKRQRVSTSFKKEMQDIKQLSFFFSSSAKASHHLHDSPHKVGTGLLQIPDIRMHNSNIEVQNFGRSNMALPWHPGS